MDCQKKSEQIIERVAFRTAIDRGVETLVAGELSTQFMGRLRSRIAMEPVPRRWNLWAWRIWEQASRRPLSFAAGVLVLATVLLVAIAGLPRWHVSAPLLAEVPATSSAPPIPAANLAERRVNVERPRKKFAARAVPSPRSRREPEVLVPKGELLTVARFYESTRSSRVDTDHLYATQQEAQRPLEVKPIEITPLESLNPSVTDPGKGPSLF